MAVKVSAATWVGRLTDRDIGRVVGEASLGRARGYAVTGAVRTLVEGDRGRVLLATVSGSRPAGYQTVVRLLDDAGVPRWSGSCSCPVGFDCKHTAAVLLTAREALQADTPAEERGWERMLAPLVQSAPAAADGLPGLGLEVSLVTALAPTRGTTARRVRIRPLREGRNKPWVRQGAGWSDLTRSWGRPDVRPDHRAVLGDILALHRATAAGYYGYGSPDVEVDDLGPAVWPLLRRCELVGIPLVAAGDGLAEVTLVPSAAEVRVDVRRHEDGLTVRPVLAMGEATPVGARLLLGDPAHGVAVLGADGTLTLAPLAAPPPAALGALLQAGTTVEVPGPDVPRFLGLYYPVLARRLAVGSSDDSVALPEGVTTMLTLEATYRPGHRLELRWGFAYQVPAHGGSEPAEVRVGLTPGPTDPPRDLEHEHALLAGLTELDALPRLRHRSATGALHPSPQSALVGMDTVTFTTEVLPALQAREDVHVDVTGEPPAYEEAEQAPVVHLETRDTDEHQGDWFDLHVTVSVDGQEVPFAPLFAALARGEEVMLLDSGTWFPLDRPELTSLRALIEEARELSDADGDTLRVSRYQVGLWEELVALGVVEQQSARWGEAVSGLLGSAEQQAPAVPAGLQATLRPYQEQGYQWLAMLWDARLGGVLADDMGLGKTLQALAMAVRAHERGELADPLLVVAPASVVGTWVEEAARFSPGLRVVPVTATGRRRGTSLAGAVDGAQVVVTSYTLLRLEADDYQALRWSGLVLDEAQFVKNHRSRTYQAARRLGAPFTLAITGTPLENSLMDLWAMLSLAAPGLFPRPEVFAERYRRPIETGAAPEQLQALRRRVRPFLLRRTKDQVAPELPPKQEQVVHIALSPAHRRIYGQHLQRERQRVLGLLEDMDRHRVAIFRALTLLRQLSLDPVLVDEAYAGKGASAKVEALLEQLEEVAAEGHRALVFSSFTGFLGLVRERLDAAGIGYSYLDGRTRDRPRRIAAFREGDDPVFLISLKAGGFGLTLTEADYVFILDPWWNPAAEAQAVDRTHRIGQERPVMVYRLVSSDTIEDKVVALQQRKRDLFSRVVDEGEYTGGGLTADDIRGLLDG
ncbi:DEAD/DEAH box helicase [Ornithinimicrobium sediminis]|uniref:DEAD/DEAH box helicase n=1 Tax=Ornithinimicrobium sediminis TaxID=2904603 RepID=UPI002FCDCB82